ncbi:MAG: hypothetical protein M3Q05_09640 [Bacteroidota bacterium]|nr:hypothetical protein [Bacteroidota bacterium]
MIKRNYFGFIFLYLLALPLLAQNTAHNINEELWYKNAGVTSAEKPFRPVSSEGPFD